ncbi:hypothetical protein [Acinetobacter sp. ABJ_C5_2]|uniref:hypothetical protein n=1 Tax=Acinetobacter sp. ABJ_C5_2 TaxID=3376992 RepID=UPI0037C8A942
MTKILLKSLLILSFINFISGCDDSKWLKQNDLYDKEVELVQAPGSNWIPSKYIEEQSGKVTYNFATASELLNTTAEPYSKDSRLIFLYKQEPNNNSILLTVTRGLAICPEADCDVIFKFDEEKPVKVKMFVLDDFDGHSFQIRSAQDKEKIIKLLKKSKQLKVDISLINNGVKTAQFDISDFNNVFERFLKGSN